MSHASMHGIFLSALFVFETNCLAHFLFYTDMAGSKNNFANAACTARKGKTVAGMTDPPPKRARRTEEITMFPPPPPLPVIEDSIHIQSKSSTRVDSASVPISIEPSAENASVQS